MQCTQHIAQNSNLHTLTISLVKFARDSIDRIPQNHNSPLEVFFIQNIKIVRVVGVWVVRFNSNDILEPQISRIVIAIGFDAGH